MGGMARRGAFAKVRTTVDLPETLQKRVQEAVARGTARSQNALIVQAVERFLRQAEQDWLDSQFAAMATDDDYQTLQLAIAAEFAPLVAEADDAAR